MDSEHSAAYQLLEGRDRATVDSLVLTASGGPFRGRSRAELSGVSPEEALAHPTWSMGPKITVDSATLMNKGLELIEAHFLFGLPYERIEVVIHPTSVVHALVRFRDGAALAHLGYPDMRVPISYALTYPDRAATPLPPLDLASGLVLEFAAPDEEAFPCLRSPGRPARREAARPASSTPPTRWRWPRSWTGSFPSSGSPRWWSGRSPQSSRRPCAPSTSSPTSTRRRAATPRP